MAGTVDMNAAHLRAEHADEVHRRGGAAERLAHAVSVGDVGAHEAELPNLRQWLDGVGLFRIALSDAHPNAALEQKFAGIAADESATTEYGHQLVTTIDHGQAR